MNVRYRIIAFISLWLIICTISLVAVNMEASPSVSNSDRLSVEGFIGVVIGNILGAAVLCMLIYVCVYHDEISRGHLPWTNAEQHSTVPSYPSAPELRPLPSPPLPSPKTLPIPVVLPRKVEPQNPPPTGVVLQMPQISVQQSHTWAHASCVDPYTF